MRGVELPDNRLYRVIIVTQQLVQKEVPLQRPERTPSFHSFRSCLFCLLYGYKKEQQGVSDFSIRTYRVIVVSVLVP